MEGLHTSKSSTSQHDDTPAENDDSKSVDTKDESDDDDDSADAEDQDDSDDDEDEDDSSRLRRYDSK